MSRIMDADCRESGMSYGDLGWVQWSGKVPLGPRYSWAKVCFRCTKVWSVCHLPRIATQPHKVSSFTSITSLFMKMNAMQSSIVMSFRQEQSVASRKTALEHISEKAFTFFYYRHYCRLAEQTWNVGLLLAGH